MLLFAIKHVFMAELLMREERDKFKIATQHGHALIRWRNERKTYGAVGKKSTL